MPKEYKIETLQDILEAVAPDKIDNFLVDFKNFLILYNEGKETARKMGATTTLEEFIWIDDGKFDITENTIWLT